jgi:hypothetical protein
MCAIFFLLGLRIPQGLKPSDTFSPYGPTKVVP